MTPATGFARMWASVAAVPAVMLAIAVASDFEPTPAAPASAAPAAPALDVTLTEFAVEPAELTVAAGAPFEVRVTNEGTIPHDFVITGVGATPLLQAGESAVLAVEALEPGAYEILCAEAGHESAGMHAVLQVSADPQGGVDSG
ncbi:MAG TPA: cupredoxin domain-containing protein, partial [Egibacteraceae bacterium]|nr:cupredoxin domain-containing protein [Egibacteraceae bacterium]